MKIVCDACSAKYSIADEKVRGKVFKIRCKKCSNIIVVRGTADEQPQDQYSQQGDARTYDYDSAPGDDAVWHLVINQEQVGPMTDAEVRERFARGEVDLDTYTWREGFTDWSPLGTVEPFTDLQAAAGAGAYAGAGAGEDGATVQSDPADLFAAATGGAGAGDDAAADLFGGSPPGGGSDGMFGGNGAAAGGADAAMSAEAERKLRGERNENSVLFSLNNLAALATESPKPSSSAGPGMSAPRPGAVPNTGGSEGSGLIDIRSMAQIYHGDRNQSASSGAGSDDDLPVFGQSSFAAPAPVLLPTPAASNTNNKPLYIMLGVIGVLVVAAAVLVILVVKGGGKDTVAATDPAGTAAGQTPGDSTQTGDTAGDKVGDEDGDTAGDKAGDTDGDKQAAAKDDGGKDDDGAAASAKDKDDDKDDRRASASKSSTKSSRSSSSSGSSRRSGSSSSGSSSSSSSSKSGSSSSGSSSSSSGGCLDEVGCLLADKPPSCCSKYSGGSKKRSSGGSSSSGSSNSSLPEQPSRSQISSSMSKVGGRVTACGSRFPGKGQVKVTIKVAGSGSVSGVDVKSAPNPSLGNCVASAVKAAKFPKTQRGITFTYPYRF